MEWIKGTKLTAICKDCDERAEDVAENLALIQTGIECTLSQLLDPGLLHAHHSIEQHWLRFHSFGSNRVLCTEQGKRECYQMEWP
jgi:hypothetical protein